MRDLYINTVIEFKNWEKTIFSKITANTIKNAKSKVDVLLCDTDLEALDKMSFKNASDFLKTFQDFQRK